LKKEFTGGVHALWEFGESSSTKMTDRTLPLLFVNLGGEMLYIIEDRLTNQEITPDKTKKGEAQYQKSVTPS
jgi:hypothetical protein